MPRIRKRTSNRVKTRDREKIKKKVRDGRKKKAKASKKNPQWKSKKPKDPGIPNDFPYKDQILAEVQEQRRIAAEEKLRLKEEKRKTHTKAKAIEMGNLGEEDEFEGPQSEVSGGEIASLSAKAIGVNVNRQEHSPPVVEMEEEAPVPFNHDLPNLLAVLEKADVILEVLDARDPLAFRSKHVEGIATEKGKRIIFVLNKIDRCPREAVAAWNERLRTEHPTLPFRSASAFLPEEQPSQILPATRKGKSKVSINDALGAESIISCLSEWANTQDNKNLTVAVVGLANVGKSSLINSLQKKSSLAVYAVASSSQGPTTTELPLEVSLHSNGATITLIDTPGFSFVSEDDVSLRDQNWAKDILLRSKGRIDRLKDPVLPIPYIVSRASNEDLMLLYSLPAFPKDNHVAFLSGVARANQLVKRKGELDHIGAARLVLRDWNSGRFTRYTTPPTPPATAPPAKSSSDIDPILTSFLAPLYAKDETILALLATRKEIRKTAGLVKLTPSEVEERQTALEDNWVPVEDDEDESEDDEDESDDDGNEWENDDIAGNALNDKEEEEEGETEEEQEDEDGGGEINPDSASEEEDEEAAPAVVPRSRKQKRKRGLESSAPARPAKKVSLVPASSSEDKKGRLRSHQQDLSEAKAKSKVASAAVPKASPKSILKKGPGPAKGVLQGKVANTPAAGEGSPRKGDGDETEIYDFGKFF